MSKTPKVQTPKPWDVLATKDRGDPTPDTLHTEVGRALTEWERLDERQGFLFSILVNSRAGAAEAAYGMVVSPASRSDMVVAAARCIFTGKKGQPTNPLLDEIESLINEVRQLSGRRNDIAHGIVDAYHPLVSNRDGRHSVGFFLGPAFGNPRKNHPREEQFARIEQDYNVPMQHLHKYAYTADQVAWYRGHFTAYQTKMVDLYRRVDADCKRRWPPPTSHAPEYERKIRELQNELTALKSAQQPQSSQE